MEANSDKSGAQVPPLFAYIWDPLGRHPPVTGCRIHQVLGLPSPPPPPECDSPQDRRRKKYHCVLRTRDQRRKHRASRNSRAPSSQQKSRLRTIRKRRPHGQVDTPDHLSLQTRSRSQPAGTVETGMQAASIGTVATGSDFDTSGYEVGRSIGKMYFYEPPGDLAQLQPFLVYNGPAYQSEILIALPPHVMVMEYFVSSCQLHDETAKELPNGDFAWSPPVVKRLELDTYPRRGIRCTVPSKTDRYVTLQVTLNGQQ
jgi:hypothetical protein